MASCLVRGPEGHSLWPWQAGMHLESTFASRGHPSNSVSVPRAKISITSKAIMRSIEHRQFQQANPKTRKEGSVEDFTTKEPYFL